MKIIVLLTCFNRKNKTKKCIETLVKGNIGLDFNFIVVDDNSNDGTADMLFNMKDKYNINIIQGNGGLYYCGGMRTAMDFLLNNCEEKYDYLLMINDDVEFMSNSIKSLVEKSKKKKNSIIVGATKDDYGNLSYGAIKYLKKGKVCYKKISIDESMLECDTFNANCVLIPYIAFKQVGSIDKHYKHSLGDFDYGLDLKRNGWKIYTSNEFVGICNNNSIKNTWQDKSLSRIDRLKKKESIKGAPLRPWIYFLKKNFGIYAVIRYSLSPYIRIILGK